MRREQGCSQEQDRLVYMFRKSKNRKGKEEDKEIPAGRSDPLVVLKHSLVVITTTARYEPGFQ